MTIWLGVWHSEDLPDFWLDGSNGAIRKFSWRNELYEGSNHFYVGQTAFDVLVEHFVKDLRQVIVQQTAGCMRSAAQGEVWARNTDWEVVRAPDGKLHRTHTCGKVNN